MSEATAPAGRTAGPADEPLVAPGPGTWIRDAVHAPRPVCRFAAAAWPDSFRVGFARAYERYGVLVSTFRLALVRGFLYSQAEWLGSSAERVPPSAAELDALLAGDALVAARCRAADAVWTERRWRADLREWDEVIRPRHLARRAALDARDLAALPDAALLAHLADCSAAFGEGWVQHHVFGPAALVPVGDYLAQAGAWTGLPVAELLAPLAGGSAASDGGGAELAALARAVAGDRAAAAAVADPAAEPGAVFAGLLAAPGPLGAAARAYEAHARYLPVDLADSVAAPATTEEPALVLARLRTAVAELDGGRPDVRTAAGRAAERLRAAVPAAHRAAFDDLLAEARLVYRLRDERAVYGDRSFGAVARRAVLEVGRRLVARGLLAAPDHAVDLDPAEAGALLTETGGPAAAEVEARVRWRCTADYRQMPPFLGPPPAPAPPADRLPPGAARVRRAYDVNAGLMFADVGPAAAPAAGPLVVRGLAAGGGVGEGTARVVGSPADLSRVRPGDVLVTTSTAPAFNIVLPLLAGLVTDRGGLLSHAAIVAREFGLPAVVGCADATVLVPDGARVRVDAAAGTVTVLDPLPAGTGPGAAGPGGTGPGAAGPDGVR